MPKQILSNLIRPILSALILSSIMLTSGCSLFSVYQIDLPQGTPITQAQAKKVQLGMQQGQVLYHLGSPALRDTLAPRRWDYIYDYMPGTDGKRANKEAIRNASQHLIIYFDDANTVSKIEGFDTLPVNK